MSPSLSCPDDARSATAQLSTLRLGLASRRQGDALQSGASSHVMRCKASRSPHDAAGAPAPARTRRGRCGMIRARLVSWETSSAGACVI
eukprot:6184130-Pleurochrysis_carterae.AAC.1